MLFSLAASSISSNVWVSDCCSIVPPRVDSFRRVINSFLQPAPNKYNFLNSSLSLLDHLHIWHSYWPFLSSISHLFVTFILNSRLSALKHQLSALTCNSQLVARDSQFLVRGSQLTARTSQFSNCSLIAVLQSNCVDPGWAPKICRYFYRDGIIKMWWVFDVSDWWNNK